MWLVVVYFKRLQCLELYAYMYIDIYMDTLKLGSIRVCLFYFWIYFFEYDGEGAKFVLAYYGLKLPKMPLAISLLVWLFAFLNCNLKKIKKNKTEILWKGHTDNHQFDILQIRIKE